MYAYLKNHEVRMRIARYPQQTRLERDREDEGEDDDDGGGGGAGGAQEVGEELHEHPTSMQSNDCCFLIIRQSL